jgi:hypothetical protein
LFSGRKRRRRGRKTAVYTAAYGGGSVATTTYELRGLENIMANSQGAFSKAWAAETAGLEARERAQINRQFWVGLRAPDPWTEAVKWIERRHQAREEWPFPW